MIKNEYHHGNLKDDFLTIAFDFIAKEDIEKLTLKILSDATGTSRSAIYRHFNSKDQLIETMIQKGFEHFDDFVSLALKDKNKPLIDRFYLSGKAYLEFAKQNSNLYRLLFGNKYANIREEIISIKDVDCSGFGALKAAVEEGQASGILKKEDSFYRTILLWSSLHGLSSLIIDGFMDIEKISDELYEKMFQDMLSSAVASKVKFLSSMPFGETLLKPKI
ncbi:TetR/AcrR family transcriptional regulator [bacterium]|nr:TetR/AcrR family transcriptional regulator [bacterium]MBU1883072.1 TetR/AcrR family transcriptional regulator [bacterium]